MVLYVVGALCLGFILVVNLYQVLPGASFSPSGFGPSSSPFQYHPLASTLRHFDSPAGVSSCSLCSFRHSRCLEWLLPPRTFLGPFRQNLLIFNPLTWQVIMHLKNYTEPRYQVALSTALIQ